MRKLYTLLILWCAFMIAPGVLEVSGLFGPLDTHTDITGGLIFLWILGYLTQFGMFMWIMNIVGEQKILWWFGASLLPWAIDWTVPVSPLFFLAWLPVTIAVAGWIVLVVRGAESFRQRGVRASGVVLEVFEPRMNVVINNVYIKRKVRLRIEREDGVPAYEGVLNGTFMLGEIPSVGDRIPLLVDPAKPQRFEYDKEERPASAAPARAAAASYPRGGGNIANELEKLADLKARGALTESEFAAAKKKLLRG